MNPNVDWDRACVGSLLGTAIGDALGLPYEGLSPSRVVRLFPRTDRHHLLPGRGLVSDDTDHACFTARALLRSGGDREAFTRELARQLRWWFAALPAGTGLATARAAIKLWLRFPPEKSGVWSAGNGPAMRAPIIGVFCGNDPEWLRAMVGASTGITHRDPKAFRAALAVAWAAHLSATGEQITADTYLETLAEVVPDAEQDELVDLITRAARSAERGEPVVDFAQSIGSRSGISGYSYHTVPCVLQCWLRHPEDFGAGLQALIRAGGDTDTTGAIYGGIVGARVGTSGIPVDWQNGLIEWPRSRAWMTSLGRALAASRAGSITADPGYFWPATLPRNLILLIIVLAHGLRRLAPPW